MMPTQNPDFGHFTRSRKKYMAIEQYHHFPHKVLSIYEANFTHLVQQMSPVYSFIIFEIILNETAFFEQ